MIFESIMSLILTVLILSYQYVEPKLQRVYLRVRFK